MFFIISKELSYFYNDINIFDIKKQDLFSLISPINSKLFIDDIKYITIKIEKYHIIILLVLETTATGGIENKHHNILIWYILIGESPNIIIRES